MAPDLLRQWSLHCVAKWGILGTEGSPFLPLSRKPSNHLCAGQKLREAKVLGRRAMPRRGVVTAEDTLCPRK